jgi:hypothetical protein
MLTRVVLADNADSCELLTDEVLAPEHATDVYEAGAWAAAQRAE